MMIKNMEDLKKFRETITGKRGFFLIKFSKDGSERKLPDIPGDWVFGDDKPIQSIHWCELIFEVDSEEARN